MRDNVLEAVRNLIAALQDGGEYRVYAQLREDAFARPEQSALYREYKRLQLKVQANAVSGGVDEALEKRLQQLAETLHFDAEMSEYLLAEYKLSALLGEVYQMLAEAVGVDLSSLSDT